MGRIIPYMKWTIKNVPNHQPVKDHIPNVYSYVLLFTPLIFFISESHPCSSFSVLHIHMQGPCWCIGLRGLGDEVLGIAMTLSENGGGTIYKLQGFLWFKTSSFPIDIGH